MADEKETVDIQRLIGEVAARHRFLLKIEDPAIALITMNQLILDSSLAAVHKQIRATIAEFHASLEKAEERAGSMLAQKVKESADQMREGLHERHSCCRLESARVRASGERGASSPCTHSLVRRRVRSCYPNIRWRHLARDVLALEVLTCGF